MDTHELYWAGLPNATRFRAAVSRFDSANAADPNVEIEDGHSLPRELVYARRLSERLMLLAPQASEPLRLAARCQHLCRWEIPREDYELNRAGYLRWRKDLQSFHARKAAEILREAGYDDLLVSQVTDLVQKKDFPRNPDSRVLEDALCLVFLQFQFPAFAARTDDGKVIEVLRKTWKKMTDAGRHHALELCLGERERDLLRKALEL